MVRLMPRTRARARRGWLWGGFVTSWKISKSKSYEQSHQKKSTVQLVEISLRFLERRLR